MSIDGTTVGTGAAGPVAQSHEFTLIAAARSLLASRAEWAGLLTVAAELLLADLALLRLDLFTPAFRRVALLALPAFLLHHFVPRAYRMRAFAVLCGAALLMFLGGSPDAFWSPALAAERSAPILVAAAVLAGICVLPLRFWTRAALLAGAGGVIAACRAGFFFSSALALVWPVLAGLFMFRVVLFLYHTSTMPKRPSLAEAFSYFFLLPNICAGLFPVVDFKRFVRSHYEIDAIDIYQRGARMIGKGVVQLVVYRLVQQLVAIGPDEVATGRDVARYILSNSFLYVKISGQFHFFIGMLLLFGFNLPDANRRYFLASSFTDYWRRVNVYWKDFILTAFYYPAYFRFKRFGATPALIVATVWSFFVTWALHLYQTWWLKGSTSITWPDALFWSILGLLVLANSLWEASRGRVRKLATSTYSLKSVLGLLLRTAATFATVSLLWSLWSTPTLSQWIGMWRVADRSTAAWFGLALVGVMAATIVFEVLPPAIQRRAKAMAGRRAETIAWRFALGAAPLVAVLAMSSGHVQAAFDSATAQSWKDAVNTGNSMLDDLVVHNGGYYEHLTSNDEGNRSLWETLNYSRLPETYDGPDPIRPVHDLRFFEFLPNVDVPAYYTDFRTNRWGMRDRDRELAKAPGTVRIAVLGASHAMGWGVASDATLEAVLERRLNAEYGATGRRFEVLNFAAYSRSPLSEIASLQQWVAPFHPDIVLVVSHTVDAGWVNRDLSKSLRLGLQLHDNVLSGALAAARITPRTNPMIASTRLGIFESDLLEECYRRIGEEAAKIGAVPAVVFLPAPLDLPMDPVKAGRQTALVRRAGVELIDFTHLWDGQEAADLMRLPDHHINVKAHAAVADALHDALMRQPALRSRMHIDHPHHMRTCCNE